MYYLSEYMSTHLRQLAYLKIPFIRTNKWPQETHFTKMVCNAPLRLSSLPPASYAYAQPSHSSCVCLSDLWLLPPYCVYYVSSPTWCSYYYYYCCWCWCFYCSFSLVWLFSYGFDLHGCTIHSLLLLLPSSPLPLPVSVSVIIWFDLSHF